MELTRKFKGASPRLVVVAGAAGLVVLLVFLASTVTSGSNSRLVAENARSLHWVNSVLGSAGLARAANAQAVVFAVDHHLGVATSTALETAIFEARSALQYLDEVVNLRPVDSIAHDPRLEEVVDAFQRLDRQVLTDVELGNVAEAVQLSQGTLERSYENIQEVFGSEQATILGNIEATETEIGRAAALANVAVTLLIPGAAITIYFLFVRRQMRERKLAMEYRLEAALQLSRSKDEFIGSLSHELRTPLTSIYGFSEVLLDAGVLDPKQANELITIINTESSELMRMVDDLLTGARLDAEALTFDLQDVEVMHEIESVIEPFRRAGHQITLSGTPISVRADEVRLRQILRNLISNAQKHGGPQIAVGTQIRDNQLVLAVVDNGPGVPEAIEGRLFQRFVHDGKEAVLVGSVGLGLAIAQTLTHAMDGTLQYERIEGHTVFSLTLPLAQPAEAPMLEPAIGDAQ